MLRAVHGDVSARVLDGAHVLAGHTDHQFRTAVAVQVPGGQRGAEVVALLGGAADLRVRLGDAFALGAEVRGLRALEQEQRTAEPVLAMRGLRLGVGLYEADREVVRAVPVEVGGGERAAPVGVGLPLGRLGLVVPARDEGAGVLQALPGGGEVVPAVAVEVAGGQVAGAPPML